MNERLQPIAEPSNRVSKKTNKKSTAVTYICPRCGNIVSRRASKYHCGACSQLLAWPGVDYDKKKGDDN